MSEGNARPRRTGRPGPPGKSRPEPAPPPRRQRPAGFAPRAAAVRAIADVIDRRMSLEDALDKAFSAPSFADMEGRDRAFARLLVVSVLRRAGGLRAVVSSHIGKPLPKSRGLLDAILMAAAAQLLLLDTPPHAAISLAVEQARADFAARRFDKLVNAVLRRVAETGKDALSTLDTIALDIPAWLIDGWRAAYGAETARAIAQASLAEPALDLSVKCDAKAWAETLGGVVLPTGSVRVGHRGRIEDLAGYGDGAWWVQDAAAALPARLLGDVRGLQVADLCAAPGGKTAELAAAGAVVTAVDGSAPRLARLADNMARLKLQAETVKADVLTWSPGRTFDAVLLDAPCSATGTIRRHPDILHTKTPDDLTRLTSTQAELLKAAALLVRPGGRLVYCTCSLEPAEGEAQIARFLAETPAFAREPVRADEIGLAEAVTGQGDLRTLPCHMVRDEPGLSGMDGFFAARLVRREP